MKHILWDLNGCLIHNNKSLGTGDLPEGYGSDDPDEVLRAYAEGSLPKAYYLMSTDDVVWVDGALDAMRILEGHGDRQHIITNQEHIGLGLITAEEWMVIAEFIDEEITKGSVTLDSFHYCSHEPGAGCLCRKRTVDPGLHMFYDCAIFSRFQLYDSVMIGDNISDAVAGRMAGCHTVMVETMTTYDPILVNTYVDKVVPSVLAAAQYIIEWSSDNA